MYLHFSDCADLYPYKKKMCIITIKTSKEMKIFHLSDGSLPFVRLNFL